MRGPERRRRCKSPPSGAEFHFNIMRIYITTNITCNINVVRIDISLYISFNFCIMAFKAC